MATVEAKTRSLSEFFVECVGHLCPTGCLPLNSPPDSKQRGGHLVFEHAHAYEIVQALIANGVVGDFRPPNLIRFGFSALYLSHRKALDAAVVLAEVISSGTWRRPEFAERQRVT